MRDIIMNKNKLINGDWVCSKIKELRKDVYTVTSCLYEGDKANVVHYLYEMYEELDMLEAIIRDEKKESEK